LVEILRGTKLRHLHVGDGGIKMGRPRMRLLEDTENDLGDLKVKTWKQIASKGVKKEGNLS
jgi:hypothetical protein